MCDDRYKLFGSLPWATSTPSNQVTFAPRSYSSLCNTLKKECSAPTTDGLRINNDSRLVKLIGSTGESDALFDALFSVLLEA